MTPLRVRFAPSPTGQLHVGNVRTALFNWLLARRHGGTLILRVEDTDVERSTRASETTILTDLRWLGLEVDEGPEAGGGHGPYRQSERLPLYAAAAQTLLESGRAYYCFCTPAELATERAAALAGGSPPKYSGRCRALDRSASARRVAAGEPGALRFLVPQDREISFTDLVRGPVSFHTDIIGDPVIVRSGGVPAYNFAVVVDDAAMEISHVIRGEDHLSNTPRQILLYEALGWQCPFFAHLSMVLGPDHAPLSKRHGATSVVEFREHGYLPEALVNYLALLGWSPGGNEEVVALDEMARRFDLADVGHSAAVFDRDKLAWMNRHYMKSASGERLLDEAWRYFVRDGVATHARAQPSDEARAFLLSALPMASGSVDRLEQMPERLSFLWGWDDAAVAALIQQEPGGVEVTHAFSRVLTDSAPLDRDAFRAAASRVRELTGLKGKQLFHPLRVLLTGAESGPELDQAVPAIDRGAALGASAGLRPILSCQERARRLSLRFDSGS
ncbi:MAG: glutamate--tRNA ligase [Vicinamibacterales bacterium]